MIDGYMTVTRNGKTFKRARHLPRVELTLTNGAVLVGDVTSQDASFVELFYTEQDGLVGISAVVLTENIKKTKRLKVVKDAD